MAYTDKRKCKAKLIECRLRWVKENRCVECGGYELTPTKRRCPTCQTRLDNKNTTAKQRREHLTLIGICYYCEINGVDGKLKACRSCLDKMKDGGNNLRCRIKTRELRNRIIAEYGGCCICCGEDQEKFLQIDHINNDGNKHRREVGSKNMYVWLKQHGYPKDNFQLLCANCNYGKKLNGGTCPHAN